MKLNEDQIKDISSCYNDWSDTGSTISEDWKDGYRSGIYDALIGLGFSQTETMDILSVEHTVK